MFEDTKGVIEKPSIEEGQTIQWSKEKGYKYKQGCT